MKIGIIQYAPVFNHLHKCVDKAITLAQRAAKKECNLVVFGETWFCGYPSWLDYAPRAGQWDYPPVKEIYADMHSNSLVVGGEAMNRLASASKELDIAIAFGFNESIKGRAGHGSLYNSFGMVVNGNLVHHHRKLMPTYTERLVHTPGDAAGLKSTEIKDVLVGGLICWEHWMPLTRQAMHDAGEQIHLALWPKVHEMHQVASRQYAFEGRCYVLAVGQILHKDDLPNTLEYDSKESMLLNGGSCVIGPNGKYVIEPIYDRETIIYAELDVRENIKEQMNLDVTGHYQRPDVFELTVNRSRK